MVYECPWCKVAAARRITESLTKVPCFGDGDTGYGSYSNVERTVRGYVGAGLAGIMLEDQVSPKRCGHTKGKDVVSFDEAVGRVSAAVRARARLREERGPVNGDIVIIARTDAAGVLGMDEAIRRFARRWLWRHKKFPAEGCCEMCLLVCADRCLAFRSLLDPTDLTFLEAPTSDEEMRRYCEEVGQ